MKIICSKQEYEDFIAKININNKNKNCYNCDDFKTKLKSDDFSLLGYDFNIEYCDLDFEHKQEVNYCYNCVLHDIDFEIIN